jgi:2-methylcitrate dehydratase PrpD
MPQGGMQVLTYEQPKTGLEAKFSLQYSIAAGIVDGEYSLFSFTDEAVKRPAIQDMMKRVRAFEDPSCRGDDPLFDTRSSGSRGFVEVDVELRNGVRDTIRILRPPGHPSRELTWDDLEHKFRDCAAQAGTSTENTDNSIAALRTLETQASVADLVTLLVR